MNGKILVAGFVLIPLVFGIVLWYSQTNAYYREVSASEVVVFGDSFPVTDYRGIDADTSPLKIRACFRVDWDYAPNDTYRQDAEPLIAPSWFDCFDAEQISKDIDSGTATAVLAAFNQPFGFSRYIARYQDGRAFMWRQINECGTAGFGGDAMPEGCDRVSGDLGASRGVSVGETQAANGPPKPVQQDVAALPAPAPSVAPTVPPLVAPAPQDLKAAITLVPLTGPKPEEIDASNLKARADARQPLSFHGCFDTSYSFGLLTETFEVAEPAQAKPVTGGLACFDAARLNEDLRVGNAVAFWGVRNITAGVDRVVAVYNDGKAYVWQQKNENYAE